MRYNIKSSELIQFTEFCCPICLTRDILDTLDIIGQYECLDIYCNAELATELMRNLLSVEYNGKQFTLGMVDLDGEMVDYCDEYIFTINDDLSIWIEPAWNGDVLIDAYSKFAFVCGDCDSKILQKLEGQNNKVLIFDFEDNDDEFDEKDSEDEFENDEMIDLYSLVEGMVENILDNRYGKINKKK